MSLARKACLWTSLPSWPVVSGAGRALLDADHLELIGYVGETIGAEGTPVVALMGQNAAVETRMPDTDTSMTSMVVWIDSTDTEAPVGEANPTGCRAQARPQVRRVRPARGRRVASGQAGH